MGIGRSIVVPPRFRERLEASSIRGPVLTAIEALEPWIEHSGSPFFRDYTDHGPRHISEVLETCEGLVRPEAWKAFSGNDAAVLVLAVILHDAANHLQEDGFLTLVRPESDRRRIEELDGASWTDLWERFLAGFRRWQPAQRKALLGSEAAVPSPQLEHPGSWTRAQHDLIGEFLRRHHPRLAHEMARFGVPGPTGDPLGLEGVPDDLCDLAGFVARSHGLPLRSALGYLEKRYHRRNWKDVHAPFLMALLRVADYLQIQASRAPAQLLKVKALRSPVSRREWRVHHAIGNITTDAPDPEAVEIQILPEKVDLPVVLRLREWLTGIQQELDESWAVLGEIYGEARGGLDRLGLSLRRVRSDLDDLDAFEERIRFVPHAARFHVAGAELVGLLSRPLYGDNPGIAIRELIQNAVDAVWELRAYCKRRGIDLESLPFVEQEPHVLVTVDQVEEELWRVTVSDKGIGMTADTVRSYFLAVGRSYRNADAWGEDFLDEMGHSVVPRSGRFGIGVLAAFLLGDDDKTTELRVTTRHVDAAEDRGISFSAQLGDQLITLRHCRRPAGTKVEVWTRRKPENLRWDWYCLEDPAVEIRTLDGSLVQPELEVPARSSDPPPPWRRIQVDGFESVDWTYTRYRPTRFACNGLRIPDGYHFDTESRRLLRDDRSEVYIEGDDLLYGLALPTLSVFDPDGNLPLALNRSKTMESIPFGAALAEDLRRNLLGYYLVHVPPAPFWQEPEMYKKLDPIHGGSMLRNSYHFYSYDGVGLASPGIVSELGRQRVFITGGSRSEWLTPLMRRAKDAIFIFASLTYSFYDDSGEGDGSSYYRIRDWFSGESYHRDSGIQALADVEFRRALVSLAWQRLLVSRPKWNEIPDLKWAGKTKQFGKNLLIDKSPDDKEKRELIEYARKLAETDSEASRDGVVECYSIPRPTRDEGSPLEDDWNRFIRQPIIPCDPERRRAELRHAFEHPDLRPHIEYWEAMPATERP